MGGCIGIYVNFYPPTGAFDELELNVSTMIECVLYVRWLLICVLHTPYSAPLCEPWTVPISTGTLKIPSDSHSARWLAFPFHHD